MNWDKEIAQKFRELGLTQEQIGVVIGEIAEQRQFADHQGYVRGYNHGHEVGCALGRRQPKEKT